MNETLNATLNATINATQNETVNQTINNAGGFAVQSLFNMEWAAGVASWLNSATGMTFFSPALVGVALPVISIALLYFKWGGIMNFIDNFGKFALIIVALYLVAKAFGAF